MTTFGSRVALLIVSRQTTQDAVAQVAGVSASAVNQWINMGRIPAFHRVKKVAKFLDSTPEFLLDGVGEGPMNAFEARLLNVAREMPDELKDRYEQLGRLLLAEHKLKMPPELRETTPAKIAGLPANDGGTLPSAKKRRKST